MIVLGPAFALVGATAAAAALDLRHASTFFLACYVVLAGQIVLVLEALSVFSAVTAANFLVAEGVFAAASVTAATLLGRQPRGVGAIPLPLRRSASEHPLLVLLGVAVAAGLGYELALALLTPPNNWDSMTYHLSRAAAWRQQHRIGYVAAHTSRENVNPPNAEILVLASLLVAHSDRLAAGWQWIAEPAAMVAIYVVSLRIGAPRGAALFSALLFGTLTQVALQATTTQNDLIAASFVVTAVALLGSTERYRYALAAAALGLALGTKLTTVFALPAFTITAAFLVPRARWRRIVALVVLMALLFASYTVTQNVIHGGSPLGASPENRSQQVLSVADPPKMLGRTVVGLALDPAGVLAGKADEDSSYFGPLGGILILTLSIGAIVRRRRGDRLRAALAAALPTYLVMLAIFYRYNPWVGRFLLTPVALVIPLAARMYGHRLAPAFVGLAVATLAVSLTIDHGKPLGLGRRQSIWTMGRADAQSMQRPAMRPVLHALDSAVPQTATIAAAIGPDDWDYPLYGRRLTRRVIELDGHDLRARLAAEHATWLLVRRRYRDQVPHAWRFVSYRRTRLVLACAPSAACETALRAATNPPPRRGSRARGRRRSGPS
jgi:hypothetical protein